MTMLEQKIGNKIYAQFKHIIDSKDELMQSLTNRIVELQATIEAQEIIIKDMAQPKTCDGCKWHKVTWYNPDSKCELCARGLNDFYEPKAQP